MSDDYREWNLTVPGKVGMTVNMTYSGAAWLDGYRMWHQTADGYRWYEMVRFPLPRPWKANKHRGFGR